MPTGLRDGLGGEEVTQSGIGAFPQNPFFNGSLVVTGTINAAAIAGTNYAGTGSISVSGINNAGTLSNAGNVTVTGSVNSQGIGFVANAGSPYGVGLVVPLTARAIISGGMFVTASGGLALPAAASSKTWLGIAQATAASGATVNVILNGIAAVITEGTTAVGSAVMMGAGGGLNCVLPVTGAIAASGVRIMTPLDAVASGTTATVFVSF